MAGSKRFAIATLGIHRLNSDLHYTSYGSNGFTTLWRTCRNNTGTIFKSDFTLLVIDCFNNSRYFYFFNNMFEKTTSAYTKWARYKPALE